jgi:hypothetical protein
MLLKLIPENMFPLRKQPDVSLLTERIQKIKRKVKKGEKLSTIERVKLIELIDTLKEIERRTSDEYIYYYKPNRAQMKFVRSVCYGRILWGGNRLGKTDALVYDYCMKCLGIHPAQELKMFPEPPIFARIICPDFSTTVVKIVPMLEQFFPVETVKSFDKINHIFHLNNGSLLELKSNDQKVLKFSGVDRHLIGMDEPIKKEIFGENLTRLTKYAGSFDMTQTPVYTDTAPWVRVDLFPKAEDFPHVKDSNMVDVNGKKITGRGITKIHGTWKDNAENLEPVGLAEWINSIPDCERTVRVDGNFPKGSTFLFGDSFQDGVHSCQPFKVPEHRVKFRSIDMGIGCPTVCLWAFVGNYGDITGKTDALGKHPILFIYKEYYQRDATIPENAAAIIKATGEEKIMETYLDPKSGSKRDAQTGLTRELQWENEGVWSQPGAINVEAGLNEIASLMGYGEKSARKNKHPQIIVFTNCKETIKELKTSTVSDLKKMDALHCVSCLRWFAAAELIGTAGSPLVIPGCYYGSDGIKEYNNLYNEETE